MIYSKLFIYLFLLSTAAYTYTIDSVLIIKLPKDVEVHIPSNWSILTKGTISTLDVVSKKLESNTNKTYASSDLNFGANLFDSNSKTLALLNIRYYPELEITQAEVMSFTSADIKEIDNLLKKDLYKAGQLFGYKINKWWGTKPVSINNAHFLITKYERTSPKNDGNSIVQLIRMINGDKSFTITVSFKSHKVRELKPICDKIINSIKI